MAKRTQDKPHDGFGKVPSNILTDSKLLPIAKCVYAVLALNTRNGPQVLPIGQRLISGILNCQQSEVSKALTKLIEGGHVAVIKGANGQRSLYSLTSHWFIPKQASAAKSQTVSRPRKDKRRVVYGNDIWAKDAV